MRFTLTQVKVYSFQKETTFQHCSSIKLGPCKKTSVCASHGSPSKATCTTIAAILFGSTKENGLLKGRLSKMERQTFLFKSNFPFLLYLPPIIPRSALLKSNSTGFHAKDLNQVFNERRHSCAAVTGVDLLMLKLCGINMAPTQSIKRNKLFTQTEHQNSTLFSVVFPLSLS